MIPSQLPSSTPAPIHDIAGPVWFLPYPIWIIVIVALGILGILWLIAWGFFLRKKPTKPLTPRERALRVLLAFRGKTEGANPYEFGIAVSNALRVYIREQYGLEATTKTSLEFLESIRDNPVFSDNEKSSLSAFLETTDLLKFARLSAGEQEIRELLDTAERLVRGEAQPEKEPVKS